MNTQPPFDTALTDVTSPASTAPPLVRFGKTALESEGGKETEVYKMTLGEETILLLPLRNWTQLDTYKWVSRGKLPAGPPGLEVSHDHVKIAGERVSILDPEGSAKLEKAFNEWLALEKETVELARKKAQTKPVLTSQDTAPSGPQPLRYQVEIDKTGQVHVRCAQGKEVVAVIGLNPAGFKSLFNQGLMRKPHALAVGALHDWVEIDGNFFSFEKGNNESAKLEQFLNEHYLPTHAAGEGKDVVIYANAASSTGFDIQFPVSTGGTKENRRRPLNEATLDMLQDPVRCGLLHKEIVIKISRPNLIFKLKTPDGGERYLDSTPDNLVHATDEDGNEKLIDLSRPVNYLHLSTNEMTAVFNHPSIHKHSKVAPRPANQPLNTHVSALPPAQAAPQPSPQPPPPSPPVNVTPPVAPSKPVAPPPLPAAAIPPPPPPPTPPPAPPRAGEDKGHVESPPPGPAPAPAPPPGSLAGVAQAPSTPTPAEPGPNEWLRAVLQAAPIKHDWLSYLVYREMASELGNSSPGKLGLSNCWASAMSEVTDVSDPEFKGIFLTEKGGIGFVNQGHIARFNKGVAFVGTQEAALEGIGVTLIATGFDQQKRAVFIISDNCIAKFGVAEALLRQELSNLNEYGAVVLSIQEALASPMPLEVVWTVPAEQENPQEPVAYEARRFSEEAEGKSG